MARPLLYAGVLAAVFGLGKYHAANRGFYDLTDSFRFAWSWAYVVVLCVAAYGVGLPDLAKSRRDAWYSAAGAAGAAAVGISLVQLVVGSALLPRFVVFGAAVLLIPWYVACWSISRRGTEHAAARDRVFVVAEDDVVDELRRELGIAPERQASVVGSMPVEVASEIAPRNRPLVRAITESAATVVVIDGRAQHDLRVVEQVATLHEAGVRVRTISLFYEEWLGKLPAAELERVALFFDIGELHRARFSRVKRVVDLGAGVLLSVPFLVAVPFVLIGNLAANRGSLFYTQERVGQGGRLFRIVKFRTMRPAGDGAPNEWTSEDDPRITPFGRLMRRTHVDELPQALNILRGDLSLVGPRPEQPQYVAELAQKLPFYDLRHLVRPGLTGWAQVKYGYAGDERDALEKLQYEFFYLRRQSVFLDVKIAARTIRSVVGRGGR